MSFRLEIDHLFQFTQQMTINYYIHYLRTWSNGSAADCADLPDGSSETLDPCALNTLKYYLRGVPHYLDCASTQNFEAEVFEVRTLSAALMYDPTNSDSGGEYK